jgi:hypothetical protein
MLLPVMATAEPDGEVVTDFHGERSRLGKPQMMRIARAVRSNDLEQRYPDQMPGRSSVRADCGSDAVQALISFMLLKPNRKCFRPQRMTGEKIVCVQRQLRRCTDS